MTYTVKLETFSGPLDLLLHLIKQEEVEIHQISLTTICDRYLDYLKQLKDLDVNVSSEFLVVAATLMLIKSRSLLPHEDEVDLEEELDPEDELIQQLLEYKQFKVASRDLGEMAEMRARVFPFAAYRPHQEVEIELEELDLFDLVRAFESLMKATGLARLPRLLRNEKPLREYLEEVLVTLRVKPQTEFRELFEDARDRSTIIGRFVALLELAKRGRLRLVQIACHESIAIELVDARDLSEEEIDAMEADLTPPVPPEPAELAEPEGAEGAPAVAERVEAGHPIALDAGAGGG